MAKEIKKPTPKTHQDLLDQIDTKQAELAEAKRSLMAGDLLNPRVITSTRREVARLKTKLRELEIASKEAK